LPTINRYFDCPAGCLERLDVRRAGAPGATRIPHQGFTSQPDCGGEKEM